MLETDSRGARCVAVAPHADTVAAVRVVRRGGAAIRGGALWFASGCVDGRLALWRVAAAVGGPTRSLAEPAHACERAHDGTPVNALVALGGARGGGDAALLSAGGDGFVREWAVDEADGDGGVASASGLALAPRRCWRVSQTDALTALGVVAPSSSLADAAALGGGGATLVGTHTGHVHVLWRATGALVTIGADDEPPHEADVAAVALDRHGRLFSAARDGVLLWREASAHGSARGALDVHRTVALHGLRMYVSTVVLTETLLVSDGFDNAVRCFDFSPVSPARPRSFNGASHLGRA